MSEIRSICIWIVYQPQNGEYNIAMTDEPVTTHLEDTAYKLRITTECFIFSPTRLLLFQRDPNGSFSPGYWSIPGGHIDTDEDAMTSCMREISEETGIELKPYQIHLSYIAHHIHLDRKEIWNIFGFKAMLDSEPAVTQTTSEGEPAWIKLTDLETLPVFIPVAHYLKHVLDPNGSILFSSSEWEHVQLKSVLTESYSR